jgi:hypothetical protein
MGPESSPARRRLMMLSLWSTARLPIPRNLPRSSARRNFGALSCSPKAARKYRWWKPAIETRSNPRACRAQSTTNYPQSHHSRDGLRSQNRAPEAQTILAEIYHWFIEGFDASVLQEATILLEELSNKTSVNIPTSRGRVAAGAGWPTDERLS